MRPSASESHRLRITIVGGFFLPVPPVSGGSTEKSWFQLARRFAAAGHLVTYVSRRWTNWPVAETADGIRHVRLKGYDHQKKLRNNLLLDLIWSWRVFFNLPDADIIVVNAVALPVWLGWLKPRAGKVVIMTGRMPKGQFRHYHRISRVLAASSYVRDRVSAENPRLARVAAIYGYPIDFHPLHTPLPAPALVPRAPAGVLTLGYIGRLHEEKGLGLLIDSLEIVAREHGTQDWRLVLCGPVEVAQGGSGPAFREALTNRLKAILPADRILVLPPQYQDAALASVYQSIEIFCYPSLAEQGETFGVAIAEAMAAGAVPVVSNLACFTDFVASDRNGLVFDHRAPDAARRQAAALLQLLREPAQRSRLQKEAIATAQNYDYARYADRLLRDFAQLTAPTASSSSAP